MAGRAQDAVRLRVGVQQRQPGEVGGLHGLGAQVRGHAGLVGKHYHRFFVELFKVDFSDVVISNPNPNLNLTPNVQS